MISKKVKLHKIIHYLLIIICIMGVLLFVSEIVSALIDTESYHFGHEMFWWYKSLSLYIIGCILPILYLLLAVFVSFLVKEQKRAIVLFLFLLSYAIITFVEGYFAMY